MHCCSLVHCSTLLNMTACSTTLHLFYGLFSRITWVSRYQKGKTSLDLNEAGVWCAVASFVTICKLSAPRFRQITTPTPHHSIFAGRMLFPTPNQQCHSTEGLQQLLVTVLVLWSPADTGELAYCIASREITKSRMA